MTFYSCMEFLPQVLDLLLNSEECFKDDTTAEKLLAWLRTSSSTREYYLILVAESSAIIQFISDCLNREPVPSRTVFTLKLLGILCEGAITNNFNIASSTAFTHSNCNGDSPVKRARKEDVAVNASSEMESPVKRPLKEDVAVDASSEMGSSVKRLCKEAVAFDASSEMEGNQIHLLRLHLDRARQDVLWTNASVRCAWFEVVSEAVTILSLHFILQSVGANDVAWNCLNDSSMFVQSASENCLAAMILEQFSATQTQGCDHVPLTNQQPPVDKESLEPKEHYKDTKPVNINFSQNFSSEIFQKLLRTMITGNSISDKHEPKDNISTVNPDLKTKLVVTRKSAINIFNKMLKQNQVLSLLAAKENNLTTRLCVSLRGDTINSAVLDVVELLMEIVALTPVSERLSICETLQDVPKTLLCHQNEPFSATYLASSLWRIQTRRVQKEKHMEFVVLPLVVMVQGDENCDSIVNVDEDCRQVVDDICRQNKSTCLRLISVSLNSILEYSKEMHMEDDEAEICGALLVKILQSIHEDGSSNPLKHFLIGSTKLSKKCYDILAIICKSNRFGTDSYWITKLFTVAVSTVQNPSTDLTLLTKVLELLSELDSIYSKGDDGGNDLAFVIQKLLMSEASWEKRDSGISFIDRLIRNVNDCSTHWVCKHNFLRFLWERLTDPESYVRASAALSVSGLMLNENIIEAFLNDCNLAKEDVLMELCKIVSTDNGGFARRAAMIALTALLTHEGALQEIIVKFNPESCKSFHTSCQIKQKQLTISIAEFQKEDEQNDVHENDNSNNYVFGNFCDNSKKLASTTTHSNDAQTDKCNDNNENENLWNFSMTAVSTALNDLDWEVKLKAICYWDSLVKIVLGEFLTENESETAISNKFQEVESTQCDQNSRQVNEHDICHIDCVNVNHPRLICLFSAMTCLHKMGLRTLMASVTDYDRLVALSCCQLLIRLCNLLRSNGFTLSDSELIENGYSNIETINCSHCQTLGVKLGVKFQNLANFDTKEVLECIKDLIGIDLDKILKEKSLLINDYNHNPLLLLEDIVAAATGNEETEQLIDCY